jgi:hypothetical protein
MAAPRPYTQAEQTLQGLACQAEGFGRQAMGGLHGDVYHVTTLDGIFFFFSEQEMEVKSLELFLVIYIRIRTNYFVHKQ